MELVFHTTSGALWSGRPSAYLKVVTVWIINTDVQWLYNDYNQWMRYPVFRQSPMFYHSLSPFVSKNLSSPATWLSQLDAPHPISAATAAAIGRAARSPHAEPRQLRLLVKQCKLDQIATPKKTVASKIIQQNGGKMTLSHMKSYEINVPSFWLLQNMDMNIHEPTNK